jgi:hypothetical protein
VFQSFLNDQASVDKLLKQIDPAKKLAIAIVFTTAEDLLLLKTKLTENHEVYALFMNS